VWWQFDNNFVSRTELKLVQPGEEFQVLEL
jgi:hypothetical protein